MKTSFVKSLQKILEKLQLKLNSPDLKISDAWSARIHQRAINGIRITLFHTTCLMNSYNKNGGMHALFKDFRKIFDLVNHIIC